MKVFVSGATGYIGSRLAAKLAGEGYAVHALYRSEKKTAVLNHPGIKLYKGDIMDPGSLEHAMEGCQWVFHVAAFAGIWMPDPADIYHLNIDGSLNVIKAAVKKGVERMVITSTAGVIGSSEDGTLLDEKSHPSRFFIHYEHSKAILENFIETISLQGQTKIITVNPSRVFGPGLLSESNSVTKMIDRYIRGNWRILPGNGKSTGNYVYIDDVVEGHILAMKKGKPGERYILGGDNASFNEFFSVLAKIHGKRYSMIKMPLWIMLLISFISLGLAKTGIGRPLITPSLVKKYNHNFLLSSRKAKKELGYQPHSLEEGLRKTVEYLRNPKNRNS